VQGVRTIIINSLFTSLVGLDYVSANDEVVVTGVIQDKTLTVAFVSDDSAYPVFDFSSANITTVAACVNINGVLWFIYSPNNNDTFQYRLGSVHWSNASSLSSVDFPCLDGAIPIFFRAQTLNQVSVLFGIALKMPHSYFYFEWWPSKNICSKTPLVAFEILAVGYSSDMNDLYFSYSSSVGKYFLGIFSMTAHVQLAVSISLPLILIGAD